MKKIRNSLFLKNSQAFQKQNISDKDFLLELQLNSGHLKKFLEIEEKLQSSIRKDLAFEVFLLEFFK